MRVHHLNCGSLRTIAPVDPMLLPARGVCHCLLIETGLPSPIPNFSLFRTVRMSTGSSASMACTGFASWSASTMTQSTSSAPTIRGNSGAWKRSFSGIAKPDLCHLRHDAAGLTGWLIALGTLADTGSLADADVMDVSRMAIRVVWRWHTALPGRRAQAPGVHAVGPARLGRPAAPRDEPADPGRGREPAPVQPAVATSVPDAGGSRDTGREARGGQRAGPPQFPSHNDLVTRVSHSVDSLCV